MTRTRNAGKSSFRKRSCIFEQLESRCLLSVVAGDIQAVADTISPDWVVEGENLGFRVSVTNANSLDLILDTNSRLELAGSGYSAALATSTNLLAGGQVTLLFERAQVPMGTWNEQTPQLTLTGEDAGGESFSATLDLTDNRIDVAANGVALTEPTGLAFHPQKPSTEYFYPIDAYVQNSSGSEIVLDTNTRIEFYSLDGRRAVATLPDPVTIPVGDVCNLLFDNERASFAELAAGDYAPVLVASGTNGGGPFSQLVSYATTVSVIDDELTSIGGGPVSATLVVSPEGGVCGGATISTSTHTGSKIVEYDWSDWSAKYGDVVSFDLRRELPNDLWVEAGTDSALMWWEGTRAQHPVHISPGSDAEYGIPYSGIFYARHKTPRAPTGGIGVGVGVGLPWDVIFDDELDLSIEKIDIKPSSELAYDVPFQVEVQVQNPEAYEVDIEYGGAESTGLLLTDSAGKDITAAFDIVSLDTPANIESPSTTTIRYELVATRALPIGEPVFVDARVSSYRDGVYQGAVPGNTVTYTDHVVASLQPAAVIAPLTEVLIDAGPDARVRYGDPFVAVGRVADPPSGQWSATVDYGDGSGPLSLTIEADETFELNHTYPEQGTFIVTVTINDGQETSRTEHVDVFVAFLGPVIFVDANSAGENSGNIWEDAFTTLQQALDVAEPGQEIWVADGTYYGGFELKSGVSLFGGFLSGESSRAERDMSVNPPTILSGDGTQQVLSASGLSEQTVIDGFTIQNGNTWLNGAGLFVDDSELTVSNNIFQNNETVRHGAGIFTAWSNIAIIDNKFVNNTSSGLGGAIHIGGWSVAEIRGNTIGGNSCGNSGAGIFADHSNVVIEDNRILGNHARVQGGGISFAKGTALISNNLIAQNTATNSGGGLEIYYYDWPGDTPTTSVTSVQLLNNTIADNRVLRVHDGGTDIAGVGGGIHVKSVENVGNAELVSENNILWGNTAKVGAEVAIDATSQLTMDYSLIDEEGVKFETGDGANLGPHIIDADPLFADPDDGDYHLKSTAGRFDPADGSWINDTVSSPAIDAGSPEQPVGNEPSPHGDRINLGAYGGTYQASRSGSPPLPADDTATTDEDTAVSFNVADNDFDLDGNLDASSATALTCPWYGTLVNQDDGSFTYTPNPDFHGTDSFLYRISDSGGRSGTATVTITVNSIIDARIDVKPGNGHEVDSIHLGSKGKTPIAILSTQREADEVDDFDAALVDLSIITFKVNGVSITPNKMTLEDVDGDGDDDLLLHFLTKDLSEILTPDSVDLVLTAEFGGPAIGDDLLGSAAIKVVPKNGRG